MYAASSGMGNEIVDVEVPLSPTVNESSLISEPPLLFMIFVVSEFASPKWTPAFAYISPFALIAPVNVDGPICVKLTVFVKSVLLI